MRDSRFPRGQLSCCKVLASDSNQAPQEANEEEGLKKGTNKKGQSLALPRLLAEGLLYVSPAVPCSHLGGGFRDSCTPSTTIKRCHHHHSGEHAGLYVLEGAVAVVTERLCDTVLTRICTGSRQRIDWIEVNSPDCMRSVLRCRTDQHC